MTYATMTRVGNSTGIIIPKELRGSTFRQGCRVSIERQGDSLVITPAEEPMTLQSLMRGYTGSKPEPIDMGASMGREMW